MKHLFLFLILIAGFEFREHATPTTLSIVEVTETPTVFADNSGDNVNGNRILNSGCDLFLLFRNSSGASSATVTITAQATTAYVANGGKVTKPDITVSLAASEERHVGPLKCRFWNDASQYVQLTYSGAASSSVKVTPLRLSKRF